MHAWLFVPWVLTGFWLQTTLRIAGHDDDVNAVAFLDAGSSLIATGSDDSLIKARCPGKRGLLQS
jgi:WD40 repeat protein